MNTVTAQDFRDLKEARIKGSLNARIKALEESVSSLEQMVEAICVLVRNIKLDEKDHTDVDEDTPDEYNLSLIHI